MLNSIKKFVIEYSTTISVCNADMELKISAIDEIKFDDLFAPLSFSPMSGNNGNEGNEGNEGDPSIE